MLQIIMKFALALLAVLTVLLASPTSACAAEADEHPGHAAVFGGATIHHGHAEPTVGLEGEWRPGEHPGRWGITACAETIFASDVLGVGVLAATFHPWRGLKLIAGGGVEFSAHTVHPLARAGLAYDFHIGSVSVSPVVDLDYVDASLAQVFGLAIGAGF